MNAQTGKIFLVDPKDNTNDVFNVIHNVRQQREKKKKRQLLKLNLQRKKINKNSRTYNSYHSQRNIDLNKAYFAEESEYVFYEKEYFHVRPIYMDHESSQKYEISVQEEQKLKESSEEKKDNRMMLFNPEFQNIELTKVV